MELLFVLLGAAIALFSYHMGRNNAAPLPKIQIPFFNAAKPDNGQTADQPAAVNRRGM